MKVEHAIYDTVHEYGVDEIALRLEQSPSTVNHTRRIRTRIISFRRES